jgi:hypothetical protein
VTHYTEPPEATWLRPGDTVEMPVHSTGTSYITTTPCCGSRVRMDWGDYTYYRENPDRPGLWFDRRCAGCGWPYRVRPLQFDRVVFEVAQPPRG